MAEIFSVETPRVRMVWSGPGAAGGELRVEARRGEARLRVGEQEERASPNATGSLALVEGAAYSVVLESLDGAPVALRHRDPARVSGLVATQGGRLVHGRIAFGEAVGESQFVLWSGGRAEAVVTVEIAVRKVTPEAVAQMRAEVESVWRGAARRALAATVEHEPERAGGAPVAPEWLGVLREAVARLQRVVPAIRRAPELCVESRERVVGAARVRPRDRVLPSLVRGRGSGGWAELGRHPVRARVPVGRAAPSPDTPSHRWMRARVLQAVQRLAVVQAEMSSRRRGAREEALASELDALAEHARVLVGGEPLASAQGRAPQAVPLALRRSPRYRAALDALLLLDAGLDAAEGEIETAYADLARLYETWCVLAVVREAADELGAEMPAEPFGTQTHGARRRLGRGARHRVVLAGAAATLELHYEPRLAGPAALLVQRPDLLLVLRRPGEGARRAVLDAKYRRDDTPAYRARFGAAGPPADALGALHRYRDAIVDPEGAPLVSTAAALFPAEPEAGFGDSLLWRSRATVGVGAIPLLPGHTGWLRAWLREFVGAGQR